MVNKGIFLLVLTFSLSNPIWTQNQVGHSIESVNREADSVSRFTDSLISSNSLLHIVFESSFIDDTIIYYRHYFIDTLRDYLVKCIVDTTFEDYFTRVFHQVVIYFNEGYEFKNCYAFERNVQSVLCAYYHILPKGHEVRQQFGKLEKGWTKDKLDNQIKGHVNDDIFDTKFLQKKYRDQ